jgi:cation transport ATPase
MSDKFRAILRTKSAEQLTNMHQNQINWDDSQLQMIRDEISNRGIEVFEESSEWNEKELKELDLEHPKSDFEKNLAFIKNEVAKENQQSGIRIVSLILSIASVIVSFISLMFLSLLGQYFRLVLLFCLLMSIGSLILFVRKLFRTSLAISCISLLILSITAIYILFLISSQWS